MGWFQQYVVGRVRAQRGVAGVGGWFDAIQPMMAARPSQPSAGNAALDRLSGRFPQEVAYLRDYNWRLWDFAQRSEKRAFYTVMVLALIRCAQQTETKFGLAITSDSAWRERADAWSRTMDDAKLGRDTGRVHTSTILKALEVLYALSEARAGRVPAAVSGVGDAASDAAEWFKTAGQMAVEKGLDFGLDVARDELGLNDGPGNPEPTQLPVYYGNVTPTADETPAWVLPAAIGGGVLLLLIVVMVAMSGGRKAR